MTLPLNEPHPARTRRLLILGAWALYDGAVNTVAGTPKAGLLSLIAFLTAGALIIYGVRLPGPVDLG